MPSSALSNGLLCAIRLLWDSNSVIPTPLSGPAFPKEALSTHAATDGLDQEDAAEDVLGRGEVAQAVRSRPEEEHAESELADRRHP